MITLAALEISHVIAIAGIIMTSMLAVFGYLHIRMNSIEATSNKKVEQLNLNFIEQLVLVREESRKDTEACHSRINAARDYVDGTMVSKAQITSMFETTNKAIENVNDRICEFVDIFKSTQDNIAQTRERVARLEAKVV